MSKSFAGLLAGFVLCASAHAAEFGVGIQAGQSRFSGPDAPTATFVAGQSFDDKPTSGRLYLSWAFSRDWRLEFGYSDFGDAETTYKLRPDIVYIVTPNTRQTLSATALDVTLTAPLISNRHLQLFAELGYQQVDGTEGWTGGFSPMTGSIATSRGSKDSGARLGLGLNIPVGDKLSMDARLTRSEVGFADVDSVSVGMRLDF